MLGLGAHRAVFRDRLSRRLCLARAYAAGPRHSCRLRPVEIRDRAPARPRPPCRRRPGGGVRILVRAILIPLGYIAALFTATALIALVVWLRAYPPVAGDEVALGMTSVIVLADWFILYVLIGQAAVLPALAAVLVAEFLSLRHALYFCGAGLFVAFATARLADL